MIGTTGDTSRTQVLVVGGTPAGIVAAVRSAREGLDAMVVSRHQHLGGVLVNGLSTWDSHFQGRRSPLTDEWLGRIEEHYSTAYGPDSAQLRSSLDGPFGGGRWPGARTWEPHVAEAAFEAMLAGESTITVRRGFDPIAVELAARRVRVVVFEPLGGGAEVRIAADTVIDATYEGDVAALAGVPYRVGREARWEHDEQHAGRLFVQRSGAEEQFPIGDEDALRYSRDARAGALRLRPWWGTAQEIFSHSTGEGDRAVQAYNHRVVLSRDPDNRRAVEAPPEYDREQFAPILATQGPLDDPVIHPIKTGLLVNPLREFPGVIPIPNDKCDWNVAAIPGGVDEYPDGDRETREAIVDRHRQMALGLLYFLQNDDAVPDAVRAQASEWGLPLDEFEDNDNFPREIYIREARRIEGRKLFTENDARIGRGLDRAPVHSDSIAIAEWLLDSHDCSPDRVRGSLGDGFTCLAELTRPSQVPFGILVPERIDNLIVGGALSATHVGWGTLRVEPTLMQIAEAIAIAVALASERDVPLGEIDVDELQIRLVQHGFMISFFNDVDVSNTEPWVPAIQFLGAKGFFSSYDARPHEPLDPATALRWARTFGAMLHGDLDAGDEARRLASTEPSEGSVTAADLLHLLEREMAYRDIVLDTVGVGPSDRDAPVTRADACTMVFELVRRQAET